MAGKGIYLAKGREKLRKCGRITVLRRKRKLKEKKVIDRRGEYKFY